MTNLEKVKIILPFMKWLFWNGSKYGFIRGSDMLITSAPIAEYLEINNEEAFALVVEAMKETK